MSQLFMAFVDFVFGAENTCYFVIQIFFISLERTTHIVLDLPQIDRAKTMKRTLC